MKKTVALLLCCLLLAGSLIALAGGTCAHDGARDVETVDTEFGCWTLHYQKETCRRCGEETLTLLGREDDRHEGAATRDPLRGWIVVCSRCGKELTDTPAQTVEEAAFGWIIAQTR